MTINSKTATPISKRPRKSSARLLKWLRPNLQPAAQKQQTMDELYNLALAAAKEHGLA